MRRAPFVTRPFPRGRRDIVDALEVGVRRHMVHALLELDVTRARQLIRDREAAAGERLSFTAFIVASLARALDVDRRLQAYRDWRGRLVLFDEVDVATLVESERDPHWLKRTAGTTLTTASRRGITSRSPRASTTTWWTALPRHGSQGASGSSSTAAGQQARPRP